MASPLAFVPGVPPAIPWVVLVTLLLLFLWVDLHFFARGRQPSFREGVVWSIGWLVLSLAFIPVVWAIGTTDDAIEYTTVYLIERSLSLDNLFVFILLFAYFGVPQEHRARLLFIGIVGALVMRGVAILAGVALIERFHWVLYVLGATLLLLAYRIFRGVGEDVDPDKNFLVRLVRRFFPVTSGFRGGSLFSREGSPVRLHVTPVFLCIAAIIAADIAFAVDSIPAAFGITRDPFIIWMGNVFALLGLRALFVLVEGLIRTFRYLDQTIAIVLGLVGVKLLTEDFVKIGPVTNLAVIGAAFTIGIVASIVGDRRDPAGAAERRREVERKAHPDDDDQGPAPETPEAGPVSRGAV
jgi:tellurite resistance protein TerC